MKIKDVLELIEAYKNFEYIGNLDEDYQGLAYRRRGDFREKFVVIMDNDWPQRERQKYKQDTRGAHAIVKIATDRGAKNFICPNTLRDAEELKGKNCFFVDNTYSFVFSLSQALRNNLPEGAVWAITGSAGKSTTKSMLVEALREVQPEKSYLSPTLGENIYPSVLSNLNKAHAYDEVILEVAGSCFNRFKSSGFNLGADIAIVTNIAEAHLDYLKSLKGVAEFKSGIFNSSPSGGIAIINIDAPFSGILVDRALQNGRKVVTYGEFPSADIRLLDYDAKKRKVTAKIFEETVEFSLKVDGRHMASNSLAVLGALALTEPNDWRRAITALEQFSALPGRGEAFDIDVNGNNVRIIDESYNANTASVRASVGALAGQEVEGDGRKFAVLGDMTGMGDFADSVHLQLAPNLLDSHLDGFFLLGESMRAVYEALKGKANVQHYLDVQTLEDDLIGDAKRGDLYLLKASSKTEMSKLAESLKKYAKMNKNVGK